jgi:hypothetical protein
MPTPMTGTQARNLTSIVLGTIMEGLREASNLT